MGDASGDVLSSSAGSLRMAQAARLTLLRGAVATPGGHGFYAHVT